MQGIPKSVKGKDLEGKVFLEKLNVTVNESWYIVLFVISGSIKKLFSIDFINIYLFSRFFSINLARWKRV